MPPNCYYFITMIIVILFHIVNYRCLRLLQMFYLKSTVNHANKCKWYKKIKLLPFSFFIGKDKELMFGENLIGGKKE